MHSFNSYRDIHLSVKGRLERWNSNVGFEIKWDRNRDPNQRLAVAFNTRAIENSNMNQYEGRAILEYPNHVTAASFSIQHQGKVLFSQNISVSKYTYNPTTEKFLNTSLLN